ncbi:MAG: hypothetical protein IJZ16_02710 [Clostridia bacterium]|nr:hypothetical protein [Clostridia bacterium]
MYSVSEEFLKLIKADNREFSVKLTFNSSDELTGTTVQDISLDEIVNSTDVLTLGCACSNKITINLLEAPSDIDYENSYLTASVSLKLGEMPTRYEDVPLGKFYVMEAITKNKYKTLNIVAYDGFSQMTGEFVASVGGEITAQALFDDVKQQLYNNFNIYLKPVIFPDYVITYSQIENLTYQQVVSYLAGIYGGFARFDREGDLEIVKYTETSTVIDINSQYMNGFVKKTKNPLKITSVTSGTSENPIVQSDGAKGTGISFENPYITEEIVSAIYGEYSGFTYTPCQIKWRGNPAVQAGDIVYATDDDGISHKVLVMSQNIRIKGGMSSSIECKGKTETTVKFSNNFETTSQKLDRKYKALEQAIIDATKAIAGNSGGYVILHDTNDDGKPDEILIMDTESTDTATQVWRWNSAGLGYSGNGYNGPFKTAITADGQIVADFITTGTMSAERIYVESYETGTKKLAEYIRFSNGVIEIGDNLNSLKLKLEADEIGFYSNDKKIAYLGNNSFEIDNLTDGKIRFQTFGFLPRANGNLSFTKLVS